MGGWVGRQIRDFAQVVAELVDDGDEPLAALVAALDVYRPKLRDVEEMTQLALAEISDLRLVPPQYRALAATAERAPASVEPKRATRQRVERELL
jgi:hypothetical protein